MPQCPWLSQAAWPFVSHSLLLLRQQGEGGVGVAWPFRAAPTSLLFNSWSLALHWRLTSGAAAAWLLPGWGLRGGARAGGCCIASLPLGARVLQAQDQLWEGLAAWLLTLGRGAGRAPQEPLANGGPGQGPPSSMTVQGAGFWASEEQAF